LPADLSEQIWGAIFQIVDRETEKWIWKAREGASAILASICIAGGLSKVKGEARKLAPFEAWSIQFRPSDGVDNGFERDRSGIRGP